MGLLNKLADKLRVLFNLSAKETYEPAGFDITSLDDLKKTLEFRKNNPIYNGPWTVGINRSNGTRELCLTRRDDNVQALKTLQSALYTEKIDSSLVFLKTDTLDRAMAISISGKDAQTLINLLRASKGWLLEYGERNSPLKPFTSIRGLNEDFGVPVDESYNQSALKALLSPTTPVFFSVAPEVLTAYYTQKDGFGQDAPLRAPL